ncbi:hypothetical protein PQ455_12195 [Sphingomonas naphthae]|uniref:Lipoprotein n=1 Tax=Sphingomonas naphthae TaxID=1813468 RepID=A0ABY7THE2_9SPHN|nr:hypothetical protein [Sphingomonas naphthae]WCT72396.1 hypothetical protein PQ455_12195 [Sphingomonas naphthae]
MRGMTVAMLGMGLLAGCTDFDRDRTPGPRRNPAETRAPPPGPTADDWTDRQRACEVGRRNKQHQCIQPFPGTGSGGGAVGTLPKRQTSRRP